MNIYDPNKKMITYFWSFSFGFLTIHNILSFLIFTSLFEIDAWNFWYFILWVSFWLFGHHTFQNKSLSLFLSQILICAMVFVVHYLFSRFDICWAIKQKHKKYEKIYRYKSMHVSKPSRLLTNHLWQAWRSIYNSHT